MPSGVKVLPGSFSSARGSRVTVMSLKSTRTWPLEERGTGRPFSSSVGTR
jgi:hypothetical protein